MVMVRLQGCEVGCPWCDTKETWALDPAKEGVFPATLGKSEWYFRADAGTLAKIVENECPGPRWVLVSGGEPADHDLEGLVRELQDRRYRVALETSGTAAGHMLAGFDWVTVSPKLHMPGGRPLLRGACLMANEVKYPVGKQSDIESLLGLLSSGYFREEATICLAPLSQSPTATALCVMECQNRGWRLSVQIHKYLELP